MTKNESNSVISNTSILLIKIVKYLYYAIFNSFFNLKDELNVETNGGAGAQARDCKCDSLYV